jgi:ribonuclease J
MYSWARPRIAVPTHGERRHLLEHKAFARDLQIPEQIAPRNGDMVRLAPGRAEIIDEVPSGRLFVDGGVITPENSEPLRERRHAAHNGVLVICVVLDKKGRIVDGVDIRSIGLPGDAENPLEEALDDVADLVIATVEKMDRHQKDEEGALESAIARSVKKLSQRIWERRPVVEAIVVRL